MDQPISAKGACGVKPEMIEERNESFQNSWRDLSLIFRWAEFVGLMKLQIWINGEGASGSLELCFGERTAQVFVLGIEDPEVDLSGVWLFTGICAVVGVGSLHAMALREDVSAIGGAVGYDGGNDGNVFG